MVNRDRRDIIERKLKIVQPRILPRFYLNVNTEQWVLQTSNVDLIERTHQKEVVITEAWEYSKRQTTEIFSPKRKYSVESWIRRGTAGKAYTQPVFNKGRGRHIGKCRHDRKESIADNGVGVYQSLR